MQSPRSSMVGSTLDAIARGVVHFFLSPGRRPASRCAAVAAAASVAVAGATGSDVSPRGASVLDRFPSDEIPPDDYLSPKQIGCLTALRMRQCDTNEVVYSSTAFNEARQL